MAKCDGRCGADLGFFTTGLCSKCQNVMDQCERAVIAFGKLNPPWEYRPEHTYEYGIDRDVSTDGENAFFYFTTPDGEQASGKIAYGYHSYKWDVHLTINELVLVQVKVYKDSYFWTRVLSPFFESIPAVQQWRREDAIARERAELKRQQQERDKQALKKKYGP